MMRRQAGTAFLLVGVLLAAAACSSQGSSGGDSPSSGTAGSGASSGNKAGITSTTIKIGLVTDLTGGLSSSFSCTTQGVQGYFNMVNAEGGIGGRKLELVTADTASSASQGATAVQSLLSQGVFAIIANSGVAPLNSYQQVAQQGVTR